MKHVRLWILGAALGCFAAGTMVGAAIPGLIQACGREPSGAATDEAYIQKLGKDYGLSEAQQRSLRFVLQRQREEELQAFDTADFSALPEKLRNRLRTARAAADRRIRALLEPAQRASYDAQVKPDGGR